MTYKCVTRLQWVNDFDRVVNSRVAQEQQKYCVSQENGTTYAMCYNVSQT